MRTRTSWLAWMLTAGMALAPTMARGQDGGPWVLDSSIPSALPPRVVRGQEVPPDHPIWPVPLWHSHADKGGLYTALEFVFFRQSRPVDSQILAVRGFRDADGSIAGVPGLFVGTGAIALNASDLGRKSYQPGHRLTIGYRLQDGCTVSADWMHIYSAKYTGAASAASPPNFIGPRDLSHTFLYSPVFNFPSDYAGPDDEITIGNLGALYGIWNGADEMQIQFAQRYDEYNITARMPIFATECDRFYGICGFRFAWIWERFQWRVVDQNIDGQATPVDVAVYSNIVSNRMYGPFVGCGNEWWIGKGFAFSADLQAAILLDIVKERAKFKRGDGATQAKRARSEYTLVPELAANLNLWWYPIEGVQIRVGYSLMAFFNTISSPEPVPFNFGKLDPPWDHQFMRWFDGLNVGIGLIW